jgi:acetaldehyde dehydrogenase/alcohol dehydrogenase
MEPIEAANYLLGKSCAAAAVFSQFDQNQTDAVVKAVHLAALNERVRLAKMAYEETEMGIWEDKVIKNAVAALLVYEAIKDERTVGVISDNSISGLMEIAQPIGTVLAVTPVTNPTSTVIFKILIALKSRNPIIISPHRKASKCSVEAARICYEAALAAGAPDDCIQWSIHESREHTQTLMGHPNLALILATGGSSLVRAAYSSGTPAIGVGSGNVPVFIEKSADVPFAVEQIFISKTFDNGTICASEQAVVVDSSLKDAVIAEFTRGGGYFLNPAEIEALSKVAFDREKGIMNADIVGQSVKKIAALAKLNIPENTRLLLAPLAGVGKQYPLSSEILAPILAFYSARGFDKAADLCLELNYHGGIGHSASIFSNDNAAIEKFATLMNAGRVVVNSPSSQGAVGGIYNRLTPSFTLGCGTSGKNITTDNISAKHLLNIQRVARRRENERLKRFDAANFFDAEISAEDLVKRYNRNY